MRSVADRSGIELLVQVGTLLSASTVADLDSGLELSVVAVTAYVGGRRGELVLRPSAPTDPFPLATDVGPAETLADAPGLTPGLPPAPDPGEHAAPAPPALAPTAGPPPLGGGASGSTAGRPGLPAGTPGLGAAPGLSDLQWQRLDEGRPIVDDTSLGGPAVLLPVSHHGQVRAALRIGGLVNESAVAQHLSSGERGEVVIGAGGLIGAAIARRTSMLGDEVAANHARTLLDRLGSVVVQIDSLGRIAYVNPAFTELTGIPAAEMIGRGAMEHVHPDDRQVASEHMAEQLLTPSGGPVALRETRFLDRDGNARWMEVQGRAIKDENGNVLGFAGTLHDVTERRQETLNANAARDRAEQARDRAERSNRAKGEFLSRMSHELRTPLNAILGFAQLLELSDHGGEDADNLDQILRAGRHLLAVLNDALDVARIETGRLSLSVEDVAVEPLVDECLTLMRPAAEEAGVVLGRPATTTGVVARADRQRLRQVLLNLLSNAVKYNRPGGRVTVDLHPADDSGSRIAPESATWLRITVTDTGVGIPADRLDDAFVPFERLGAERTGVEGTGLGLSLVKSLLEAMDARIGASSVAGLGSTFQIDLPAVPAPDGTAAEPLTAAPVVPGVNTSTVLYVEDNPANVTLVQRVLSKREQLNLVVAPDGVSGLRLLEELRPALLLLDVHLPGLSGDELLAALRNHSDPVLARTPVIVVTADLSGGAEQRLKSAGADAFLAKPIDVLALLAEIDLHAR